MNRSSTLVLNICIALLILIMVGALAIPAHYWLSW